VMAIFIAGSFTIGLAFWLLGAWPVVGFCGLDIALLQLAFRLNYRSAAWPRDPAYPPALLVKKIKPQSRGRDRIQPLLGPPEVDRHPAIGVTALHRLARPPADTPARSARTRDFAHGAPAALAKVRGAVAAGWSNTWHPQNRVVDAWLLLIRRRNPSGAAMSLSGPFNRSRSSRRNRRPMTTRQFARHRIHFRELARAAFARSDRRGSRPPAAPCSAVHAGPVDAGFLQAVTLERPRPPRRSASVLDATYAVSLPVRRGCTTSSSPTRQAPATGGAKAQPIRFGIHPSPFCPGADHSHPARPCRSRPRRSGGERTPLPTCSRAGLAPPMSRTAPRPTPLRSQYSIRDLAGRPTARVVMIGSFRAASGRRCSSSLGRATTYSLMRHRHIGRPSAARAVGTAVGRSDLLRRPLPSRPQQSGGAPAATTGDDRKRAISAGRPAARTHQLGLPSGWLLPNPVR
jgi:uncharacterized membrane protein